MELLTAERFVPERADRGEVLGAVRVLRERRGWPLADVRRLVDELVRTPRAG